MSAFEPVSLDQLTMFLSVAEHGSFSAAGRELGRVQSAVSHAMAGLERSLGVRLFSRSGRRASLTPAGRRLLGEARAVLGQVRSLQQVATELRGGVEPEVELVLDLLFPRERLVDVLARFHREFPMVSVRTRWGLLDEAVAAVVRRRAHIGICNVGDDLPDELDARPVIEVQLVPVCASSHDLAAAPPPHRRSALQAATQVVLSDQALEPSGDRGVLALRTWRVSDLETKLELIRAGVGWGSMPEELVAEDLASGRLVRVEPEPWPEGFTITLHAVMRSDHPLGAAGRWILEALKEDPGGP